MKTSKAITLVLAALVLASTPALAQRNHGGSSRSSHSSSGVSSRSSGGGFSSRSSSGSVSSRSSSPSRSSSSSVSSRSSSPSRSSSGSFSSRSSSPSRSTATYGERPSARSRSVQAEARSRGDVSSRSRSDVSTRSRGDVNTRSRGEVNTRSRGDINTRSRGDVSTRSRTDVSGHGPGDMNSRSRVPATERGYARPGRPGGHMPHSSRHLRPAPYFHHPWHHRVVHCHPIYWDPLPLRPWYWPGFWVYCNNYWYDYHVTDVVVVREYVQKTYSVDLITYGISGDIMYAIVRDGGDTYLQVYDKDDHLLAEQKINKRYCNMVIDPENGGCWISKKNNKDALLFIWAEGQLLIYEED